MNVTLHEKLQEQRAAKNNQEVQQGMYVIGSNTSAYFYKEKDMFRTFEEAETELHRRMKKSPFDTDVRTILKIEAAYRSMPTTETVIQYIGNDELKLDILDEED
jgi:hypothetical protein